MYENQPTVSSAASVESGRKVWTAPVVSFLSIDETANGGRPGGDGIGTSTAS